MLVLFLFLSASLTILEPSYKSITDVADSSLIDYPGQGGGRGRTEAPLPLKLLLIEFVMLQKGQQILKPVLIWDFAGFCTEFQGKQDFALRRIAEMVACVALQVEKKGQVAIFQMSAYWQAFPHGYST